MYSLYLFLARMFNTHGYMFFEGLDIFLSPKGVENMRQMSGLLWSYILHVFLTLNVQYDSYTWNMCRKWCNF